MKRETSNPQEVSELRKSNIGVRMTVLYAVIYGGFVFLSVFFPSLMGVKSVFGLNLAIAYGLALIIIAIIFAIIYNALVRIPNLPNTAKKNQNPNIDMRED